MKRLLRACLIPLAFLAAGLPSTRAADSTNAPSWQWCGWGGGGFFFVSVFSPTNADTIYLGGDVGGLYKSTDRGRNWRFINRGLQNYGAFSLAVSKSRPETLYVMTPDGMAKSVNGGADWQPLAATRKEGLNLSAKKPGSIRAVAIDPRNPDTVYAGSIAGKLYKSADGGQTWTNLNYLSALDREPKPVVAAIPPAAGTGCLVMAYSSEAGDWKRHGRVEKFISASGADWSIYRRLSASFYVPAGAPKLEACLVVQTGSNWLWQESARVTGKPGEWVEASFDLTAVKAVQAVHIVYLVIRSPGLAYKGEFGLDAVLLHPADESLKPVSLGDWEKPGSVEGWKAGNPAGDAPQVTAIRNSADAAVSPAEPIATVAVAESDPALILVAHRTLGLFHSADAGATWTRADTPRTAASVAVSPGDAKRVYGAFGKSGVWTSADGGVTWSAASAGITNACNVREVGVDPRDPKVAYAIGSYNWGGYFYRTRDGGATWECIRTFTRDLAANPTLPDETGSGERKKELGGMSTLSNLAISPSEPDVLFLAANWNNFLSADGGSTWTERIRGADITCTTDIRFCGTNTYVTAMDEGLLISSDNGASWRQSSPRKYTVGLSGHQWRVNVVRTGAADRIVSTVFPWTGEPNAVVISEDGGKTFAKATNGLPTYIPRVNAMWGQGYARALAADPTNPDILYLGIDGDPEPAKGLSGGGVFKSLDGGRSWKQLPHQPGSRKMFYGLAVDPTEPRRLFWATAGSGLFRSEDGGESWTNVMKYKWLFNVHVSASGAVYTGDKDLSRSLDHGKTWKTISNFKTDWAVVGIETDPADEKRIWVSLTTWDGSDRGGIFRTIDGGATWQEITGDIGYRKPLVLRFNSETRELWAGGVGLFRLAQ